MSTISLVAFDETAGAWGAAVQSHYLAVGSLVPWGRAGAGVLVTQGVASPRLAGRALERLAAPSDARTVLDAALREVDRPEIRQIAILDGKGGGAAHTGEACRAEAEALEDRHVIAIGNTAAPGVVAASLAAFQAARSAGDSLQRALLKGLQGGEALGGDVRGRLAAAVMIWRQDGGYGGEDDRRLDLRVDAHPQPLAELEDLMALDELYAKAGGGAERQDIETLDPGRLDLLRRLARRQQALSGSADGPPDWRGTFRDLNLAHRYDPERNAVDTILLENLPCLMRRLGL